MLLGIASCSNGDDYDLSLRIQAYPDRTEDFSLWQLEPFFFEVQMGYILRADDGNVIVVDGGGELAAPYLESYLKQFGGTVHTWIFTHPHSDHIGAFLEIIDKNSINIERILYVPLDEAWVQKNEPKTAALLRRYNQALNMSKAEKVMVALGDTFNLGEGVHMQALGDRNESLVKNAVNNSSLVFKITSKSKSILFLGDLGAEGGLEVLKNNPRDQLKADYVQMAHHGQVGVDLEFYRAVGAEYALWPTPKWLWENRADDKGVNSGNYKINEVRKWMQDLGVKNNYVSGLDRTIQID